MSSPLWEGVREGCGTCEFAGPLNQHDNCECCRKPPVMLVVRYNSDAVSDQVEQHRPWMTKSDWCGEYRRRGP